MLTFPTSYWIKGAGSAPGPGDAAQNFDGSDDYFSASGWDISDTIVGIFSVWVKRNADDVLGFIYANSNNRVRFKINADNTVDLKLANSSGTTILDINSGATTITGTGWHHILISWELDSGPRSWFYIDDVDVESITTGPTQGTVEWTRANNNTGASSTPASHFDGCMSEFYRNNDAFFDLDTVSNRRKFIDASGFPVDLGSDGSTPTGGQPQVMMFDDFTSNAGSLANPVANGTPVACADAPLT